MVKEIEVGPTPAQVEHYVQMFEQLSGLAWHLGENLCWTIVRSHNGQITASEAIRRLAGDPDAVTMCRPADEGYDYETVFVEQRGDAVLIVGSGTASVEQDMLPRLGAQATVHGVFWAINNFNRLYRLVDGVLVTELDVLRPHETWGSDPQALAGHLDALCVLHARAMSGDHRGPLPDWQTAMATVESLTGQRLDASWFHRPQLRATVGRH